VLLVLKNVHINAIGNAIAISIILEILSCE